MDGKDASRKRKSISPSRNTDRHPYDRDRHREGGPHRPPQPRPSLSQPQVSRSSLQGPYQPPQNHNHSSSQPNHGHHAPPAHSTAQQSRNPATSPPNNYDKYKSLSDVDYKWMRDIGDYTRMGKIGQGTFGEVHKATCVKGPNINRTVALKKILMENEKEGFPITAIREIKILQCFKNKNVVELLDICSTKATEHNRYRSTFYLVFEFCEHDLAGLLSNSRVQFTAGETKKIMQQLLNGLFFVHSNKALHRDMKTSNILINKEGVLKIADFGLARTFSQVASSDHKNRFTNRVVTLWYRPPELLLGDRNYTPAIDVWGAGCIMCELWTRSPILQGRDEQHQLQLISHLCGSITPEVYPDVVNLDLYNTLELPKNIARNVKTCSPLKGLVKDQFALDLIDKIFTLDPAQRINTDDALNHDYFWTDPMPFSLTDKMRSFTQSNFEYTAASKQRAAGNRAPVQAGHMNEKYSGTYGDRVF